VQDFLHAGQVLCIAVDKTGQEERVVLPEAHTLTELPLVSKQCNILGQLLLHMRREEVGHVTFHTVCSWLVRSNHRGDPVQRLQLALRPTAAAAS
jgi:hypothetical protein